MPCSRSLYPLLEAWLAALGVAPHRTGRRALAHLLTALLMAQSLRSSDNAASARDPSGAARSVLRI